jgi:hypothetical protein
MSDINYDKILEDVKSMMKYREDNRNASDKFESDAKELYPYLFERTNSIFNLILSGNMELDRLQFIIDNAKKVKEHKMTEYDASVEVGKNLAQKFLPKK